MSIRGSGSQTIETIAVIGAGTMGHGIAQVAGASGFRVTLRDVDRESLTRGIRSIEKNLAKGIQLGKLTEQDSERILQHIHGTTALEECGNAHLIIEAAPEQLDLKRNILHELEARAQQFDMKAKNIH